MIKQLNNDYASLSCDFIELFLLISENSNTKGREVVAKSMFLMWAIA